MTTPKNSRKPKKQTETIQRTTNLDAARKTVQAMRDLGRLEPIDEARVQAFLALAHAVDECEAEQRPNPNLWREYRSAEAQLRKESEHHVDDFDKLLQALDSEVGNQAHPKPTHSRR